MKKSFLLLFISATLHACAWSTSAAIENPKTTNHRISTSLQNLETAYFASGCFWCVEAIFESIKGVKEVVSGYAGGTTVNPNYQQIMTGKTGHAETVQIFYDPKTVSFETLLKVFFESHDPTTLNRQGPDRGTQYRSIAFYQTESEKKHINHYINSLENKKVFDKAITTEVSKLKAFYKAEAYHQDYERLNPNNPYIRRVSKPRLLKFQINNTDLLKNNDKQNH